MCVCVSLSVHKVANRYVVNKNKKKKRRRIKSTNTHTHIIIRRKTPIVSEMSIFVMYALYFHFLLLSSAVASAVTAVVTAAMCVYCRRKIGKRKEKQQQQLQPK